MKQKDYLKLLVGILIVGIVIYFGKCLCNKNLNQQENYSSNWVSDQPEHNQTDPTYMQQPHRPNRLNRPGDNDRNVNLLTDNMDNNEHFDTNTVDDTEYTEMRQSSCFPQQNLMPSELLPTDDPSSVWANVNPQGNLGNKNFLQAGWTAGIASVGSTLRNANRQLRSEPPNPQVRVSPWMQTTVEPDITRKPFEIGCGEL